MSDNTVTLIGNVTRDPELKVMSNGGEVVNIGLAVNRRWMNRQTNDWEEATSFFDVVCYRELGQNVAATVKRGMRVIVSGRMEQRSWETQEGEKRSKVEVIADEVGPSLRWATAEVVRNERDGSASNGNGGGSGAARRQQPAAARPAADDEDLF